MMTTNSTPTYERPHLPNRAYDSEYATQFRREVDYLKERGIECTYIKKTGEFKVPTYKYKKTPELFRAVADFYEQRQHEKAMEAINAAIEAVAVIDAFTSSKK